MTRNATRMIENQIAEELRKLNSIITDEADKPAIMQRIADLKAMLDTPVVVETESNSPSFRELLSDLIVAYKQRNASR